MTSKSKLIVLYSVYPNDFKIEKKVKELIRKKVIVCANLVPKIESIYVWKGKIEKSKEVMVFYKTDQKNFKMAFELIEKLHPYEVPLVCVVKPEMVNMAYGQYLVNELRS